MERKTPRAKRVDSHERSEIPVGVPYGTRQDTNVLQSRDMTSVTLELTRHISIETRLIELRHHRRSQPRKILDGHCSTSRGSQMILLWTLTDY